MRAKISSEIVSASVEVAVEVALDDNFGEDDRPYGSKTTRVRNRQVATRRRLGGRLFPAGPEHGA